MQELTAVILCGGKGERMRPLTEVTPKPLVPVGGRPLLEHLVRYLEASGIRKFILCVGYKAELIEEFASRYRGASQITCVNSGDAGMTDRILDARLHTSGRLLICYGDTLANIDLELLTTFHEELNAAATMTVYPLQVPFGIVDVAETGEVNNFREKPQLPYWINIGFFLFDPYALDQLERNSSIPEFLDELRRKKMLYAFRHAGRHLTVNTAKDRQNAESEITEFLTVFDNEFSSYVYPAHATRARYSK